MPKSNRCHHMKRKNYGKHRTATSALVPPHHQHHNMIMVTPENSVSPNCLPFPRNSRRGELQRFPALRLNERLGPAPCVSQQTTSLNCRNGRPVPASSTGRSYYNTIGTNEPYSFKSNSPVPTSVQHMMAIRDTGSSFHSALMMAGPLLQDNRGYFPCNVNTPFLRPSSQPQQNGFRGENLNMLPSQLPTQFETYGFTQGLREESAPRKPNGGTTMLPFEPLHVDYDGLPTSTQSLDCFEDSSFLGTGFLSDDAESLDFEGEHLSLSWWEKEGTEASSPVTPTQQHSNNGNMVSWDIAEEKTPLPSMSNSSTPAHWIGQVVSSCNGNNFQVNTNDDAASVVSTIELPHCDSPTFVASLALPSDKGSLTPYQRLLRQSLQYFSATQQDVDARVRGRKQKIRLGQIGVRCRYCAHLQVSARGKGAVYFPKTLMNVYQATQNIASAHFSSDDFICPHLPIDIEEELDIQKPKRDSSKGGRTYWLEACSRMGIYEDDGALWLPSTRTDCEQNQGRNSMPHSVSIEPLAL